ncbi:MAG: GIY-YIG nuclease family protein [Hyphomonadaceae bacterium]|nr:GIY-YIG nuclease family protein [Hyphomonadaceae bacterium]
MGPTVVAMFYVYILASQKNGTLYVGHTDDIERRVWEHKEGINPGFTSKYGVTRLVWLETHDTRESAQWRERAMKKWNRAWKIAEIEKMNPNWGDLYLTLNQ